MPTILIVEDEKELNKVLQAYLSKAGYQTLGAYRGDEALHLWERESPDLVLLDLNLARHGWVGGCQEDPQG